MLCLIIIFWNDKKVYRDKCQEKIESIFGKLKEELML